MIKTLANTAQTDLNQKGDSEGSHDWRVTGNSRIQVLVWCHRWLVSPYPALLASALASFPDREQKKLHPRTTGDTDIENRLMDRWGAGGGSVVLGVGWGEEEDRGMYGESNLEAYIVIYKIDSQREFAVWPREGKAGIWNNLPVRRGGRWEGASKWRRRVYLWLIHVDVWQKPT